MVASLSFCFPPRALCFVKYAYDADKPGTYQVRTQNYSVPTWRTRTYVVVV